MLSKAVRDELQAELEHLRVERDRAVSRYDDKISAIEKILSDVSPAQAKLPLGEAAQAGTNGNGYVGQGFRDVLLSVIRAYPSGLKSADIARKIEATGYKPGGTSSVKSRVYGEVNRLYKAKRLSRNKGRYSLPVEKAEKAM